MDVFAEIYPINLEFNDDFYNEFEVRKYIKDTFNNTIPAYNDVKGISLPFNVELHKEKSILVYGNYVDVKKLNSGRNDFALLSSGMGYYKDDNGTYGEYRYHGYTADDNLYTSNDFPRDSDSGRTVSDKEWIYHYWSSKPDEEASRLTDFVTVANAHKIPALKPVRNAIDDMVNDVLKYSTHITSDPNYKDKEGQGYAVADHMNVMTLNSTLFNGEGKMMQENAGRIWYQMFSTEKANGKTAKNQDVYLEILNKGHIRIDGNGKAQVQVRVTGIYLDADIISDADKVVYYHKDEMKKIQLDLTVGAKTVSDYGRPSLYVNGSSAYSHDFEITIDEGDIVDGLLTVSASSYSVFYTPSGEATNTPANDSDVDYVGGGLKSLFSTADIELDNKSLLTKDMITYVDHSSGDIESYSIKVINMNTMREETFNYLGTSAGFIDDLYTFVDYDDEFALYKIVQTVSNAHTEDTYSDEFTFRKEVKQAIELEFNIPHHIIDIDKVMALDNTDYSGHGVKSKSIKIDGVEVDWDTFFSGGFSFGETYSNYLALLEICVINDQNIESIYTDAFNVHSSLPRTKLNLSGSLKENRLFTIRNDSYVLEDPFVTLKYPTTYRITYSLIDGDMSSWQRKELSKDEIQNVIKTSGFYKATIVADNGIRSSTTDFHIGIVPDFEPNIYFNIWNNVLSRNEALNLTYSADSLDGDVISSNNFKIYFDEDGDQIPEKLVHESNGVLGFYTPSLLGVYKIVNVVEESFGEATLSEFVSPADKRVKTVERIFYVDNLRPLVEIDLNIPDNFQQVDMYIMSDENLDDASITKLREGRIEYNNDLRLFGLDANVQYRDLKTYIASQQIDTSSYTGGSYPPATLAFNSNGFKGTLNRYNVSNNSYEDYYTTTESYQSCRTENVFNGYVNCDNSCIISCQSVSYNNCEASCCDSDYTQSEVCTTKTTEVRHYYTVNRYTGYYRGMAYKSIKQTYTNPFRVTSDKYVIYVAGNSFNLMDFNDLRSKADYKIILIGNPSLRDIVTDEILYIKKDGRDMDVLMQEAIDAIGKLYPFSSQYLIQVGENFSLNQIMFDSEGDPLINYGYQYVQEEIYDNPTGIESYARNTYLNDLSGFSNFTVNNFSKAGLFRIYALLKDSTGQVAFDKNSNVSSVSVLAHRKPIADYKLDWTYNNETSSYDLVFVDKSYDLDHEYSHVTKGIIDYKAMYKREGDLSWRYAIPSTLSHGTYNFRYFVKDLEGAWSEPKEVTFTLSEMPPPQWISASLRPELDTFNLSQMPVTEGLVFYDLEIKAPYPVTLSYRFMKSDQSMTDFITMSNSYNLSNQIYNFDNYGFLVPKSLFDSVYYIELRASKADNPLVYITKNFNLGVFTPIDLLIETPDYILPGKNVFRAYTSKYVDEVVMTLYEGTTFEKKFPMIKQNGSWIYEYDSELNIPDQVYNVSYEAFVHTSPYKSEKKTDSLEKVSLKAISYDIVGAWTYWDGNVNIHGKLLTDEPHRFMSLEEVSIFVETIGEPDNIIIRFSPELEAMTYVNDQGHVFLYEDMTGEKINFPLYMTSYDKINWHISYILPLADSSKTMDNERRHPSYWMSITLIKGDTRITYLIDDLDITGNTLDRLYLEPSQ